MTTPALAQALADTFTAERLDALARYLTPRAREARMTHRPVDDAALSLLADAVTAARELLDEVDDAGPVQPGEFCRRHWSWLCGRGQGACQGKAPSAARELLANAPAPPTPETREYVPPRDAVDGPGW